MIKRRRFPRIFSGWWTVLTSGILMLWGFGYYEYGFSALFKPIALELGFSRAATSAAVGIGTLEGGFQAPLAGWITDRFGPKWIVFLGVFLMGLGLTLMSLIDSLWAYYIVWGVVLGTGANISLMTPLNAAVANWFVKKRGLALSITLVLSGLSGVLVLPLIAWLIVANGWRVTCSIGGLVMWLVGLPLVWFFMKSHRPEYYGLLPDGASVEKEADDARQMIDRGVEYAAEVEEVEFTLRQAMRTPAYWLLILVGAGHGLVGIAFATHSIPFLTDRGIEPLDAATIMAMLVLVSIPARFISGFLSDRIKTQHLRFLMGGAFLLQAVGFVAFLLNQTMVMIYAFYVLYGIGMGTVFTLGPIMRGRYFGRKAFGSIIGSSHVFVTPVAVVAPIYAGWIYDTTGSYITAFTLFAGLLTFSAVLMCLTQPPKPPDRVGDIREIV